MILKQTDVWVLDFTLTMTNHIKLKPTGRGRGLKLVNHSPMAVHVQQDMDIDTENRRHLVLLM